MNTYAKGFIGAAVIACLSISALLIGIAWVKVDVYLMQVSSILALGWLGVGIIFFVGVIIFMENVLQ